MNIAECDYSVTVQTARDNRSVAKNTEMISHAVAINIIAIHGSFLIRPNKAISPFEKELISDFKSTGIVTPLAGKTFFQIVDRILMKCEENLSPAVERATAR